MVKAGSWGSPACALLSLTSTGTINGKLQTGPLEGTAAPSGKSDFELYGICKEVGSSQGYASTCAFTSH